MYTKRNLLNALMMGVFSLAALIAVVPLFAVLGYVLKNGLTSLNWAFFTELPGMMGVGGGMANAIIGTLIVVVLASVMGIPIGILAAIYLSEYDRRSWFSTLVRFTSDVLTGIPSIIVGIVVYAAIVVRTKHFSAFSGGVALAVIMIPSVIRATEEMLKLVPHTIREAGDALGIPKWRTILSIVLPTAAKGILTGALLAVARISGETAPLLFTALGNLYYAHSLNEPIATLPLNIYFYAISPYDQWHKQAWAGALVLVFIVIVLNVVARLAFRTRMGKN